MRLANGIVFDKGVHFLMEAVVKLTRRQNGRE